MRKLSVWLCIIADCSISTRGYRYTGTVNQTAAGIPCQRWDTNSPHHNDYNNTEDYAGNVDSLSDLENYCRSPVDDYAPWCYTTDEDERWDYCDIPKCTGMCQKTQNVEHSHTIFSIFYNGTTLQLIHVYVYTYTHFNYNIDNS